MKARLTITPETNIKNHRVVDSDLVVTINHGWDDIIQIYDEVEKKERPITIRYLSLFDHLLIVDGVRNRVIHMLSR